MKNEPVVEPATTGTGNDDIIINTPDTVEPIQIYEAQAEAINRSADEVEEQQGLEDAIERAQHELTAFDEYEHPVKMEMDKSMDEGHE